MKEWETPRLAPAAQPRGGGAGELLLLLSCCPEWEGCGYPIGLPCLFLKALVPYRRGFVPAAVLEPRNGLGGHGLVMNKLMVLMVGLDLKGLFQL